MYVHLKDGSAFTNQHVLIKKEVGLASMKPPQKPVSSHVVPHSRDYEGQVETWPTFRLKLSSFKVCLKVYSKWRVEFYSTISGQKCPLY